MRRRFVTGCLLIAAAGVAANFCDMGAPTFTVGATFAYAMGFLSCRQAYQDLPKE